MEKIRCTRNEMLEILQKAATACFKHEMSFADYKNLDFDIIPIDFSKYTKLKSETAKYIDTIFDTETTDKDGNLMLKGFIGDNLNKWYRDKENLHCNYAPYGFYYSGFGFNDEEQLIYTWCEGDTTVTLFDDTESYFKARAETEKWYAENS